MTAPGKTKTCKGIFLARVLANQPICRQHHKLVLEVENFPPADPGQFIQILCADPGHENLTGPTLLRRPFSIGGIRAKAKQCQIDIYLRVIGPGTRWLAQRKPADSVSILGPLGNPFPIAEDKPTAYLVGGGCGLPPLIWLAETLQRAGKHTIAFCGAQSADLLPLTLRTEVKVTGNKQTLAFDEFAQLDVPVIVSTDDGSLGAEGIISEVFTDYLDKNLKRADTVVVYTCGPNLMMQAVAEYCGKNSITCLVCLERMMACGMGTCQSCVVRIRDNSARDGWRYQLCCTDGPVFDSRDVIWDG
ncbi:MAG: dihydroorotate dehydrogenase electron transfer subunit [Planctomycetota bacterium]|nr:MAG: dihydroorotate dehydrogenase electron transfer subunit [Planctomycetota bacterium]